LELGADIDATDDSGQKPIHAAAMNNYAEVAQLFLQQHPSLVMACTKVRISSQTGDKISELDFFFSPVNPSRKFWIVLQNAPEPSSTFSPPYHSELS
jgi:ankyrin repeat protein